MRIADPSRLGGLLLSVMLAAACEARAPALSETHAAAIRDSVMAVMERYQAFSAARNWDSLATFYVQDDRLRWIEDGAVRYRSVAAIREAWSALPPGITIETSYRDMEVRAIAPGAAVINALFDSRMVDPSGGPSFTFGGALTATLIHEAAGWRFLGGHTSSRQSRPR